MEAFVHDAVLDMRAAREQLLAAIDEVGSGDWGRYVPYGDRTLKELLAHVAAADRAWALSAQGLLKADGDTPASVTPEEALAVRDAAIERGRGLTVPQLRDEMTRRRTLLLTLYELLERRHLPLALPAFGEHNSVRERIWRGYHDRMHAADVRRAMRIRWYPQGLAYLPQIEPVVSALAPDETLYVIHSIDPVAWEEPSPLPEWSYRRLLAHIATGDWVLQMHLRSLIETGAVAEWPKVDDGNAALTAERAHSTPEALTEEYLSMRHETCRLFAQLRPEHLDAPITFRWAPEPNTHPVIEYLLRFEMHDRTHREQLRGGMRHARALRGA